MKTTLTKEQAVALLTIFKDHGQNVVMEIGAAGPYVRRRDVREPNENRLDLSLEINAYTWQRLVPERPRNRLLARNVREALA